MKAAAVVILVALGGVAAFLGFIRSESTRCFAHFDSRAAAERVALLGRAAGFDDAELEASGPEARKPTSPGARAISVIFRDGETGDDAAGLRRRFQEIVRRVGGEFGHTDDGCVERSRAD